MIFIICVVSSNEWIKLHEQAGRSWPGEELSRGEVLRRLSLAGCEAIKQVHPEQQKAMGKEFKVTLAADKPWRGQLPGDKKRIRCD